MTVFYAGGSNQDFRAFLEQENLSPRDAVHIREPRCIQGRRIMPTDRLTYGPGKTDPDMIAALALASAAGREAQSMKSPAPKARLSQAHVLEAETVTLNDLRGFTSQTRALNPDAEVLITRDRTPGAEGWVLQVTQEAK